METTKRKEHNQTLQKTKKKKKKKKKKRKRKRKRRNIMPHFHA
jgi:hypothetical protein